MTHTLSISADDWRRLGAHLHQDADEQAAMLYCLVSQDGGGVQFRVHQVELLRPSDFDFQSSYHISLTDAARGRIIKHAWDSKCAIVEAHSHVGKFASAEFSPSDRSGLEEFVPHVRWRLRGIPYGALVVTDCDVDGLVWAGEVSEPEQLDQIVVDERTVAATGATLSRGWAYD